MLPYIIPSAGPYLIILFMSIIRPLLYHPSQSFHHCLYHPKALLIPHHHSAYITLSSSSYHPIILSDHPFGPLLLLISYSNHTHPSFSQFLSSQTLLFRSFTISFIPSFSFPSLYPLHSLPSIHPPTVSLLQVFTLTIFRKISPKLRSNLGDNLIS